jgi:ACS family hexuronate transporter-like MFS transporter
MSSQPVVAPPPAEYESAVPLPSFRWVVCALLFLATTINYMDRQILGILAKTLQNDIHWSEAQYSYIVMAFQAAYAIGLLSFGWLIDRWGTKRGYTVAIFVWSLGAAAHALARSVLGFGIARFVLGIGEAGNFPAAIKSVAEWFPKRERAFATGIFNSGSNVGAIIAPAIVPFIALHWGWRAAFVILGASGFAWIILWYALYERPERSRLVSARQLTLLQSEDGAFVAGGFPWRNLIGFRQTWAYIIPSVVVNPIWWFYLYWLPKFLGTRYHLDLANIGLPLVLVYSMAMFGSVLGGWLSSRLIHMGSSVNLSRKTAMLLAVACVVPVAFITRVDDWRIATLLAGMATFGHQALSANLFTMASDLFPKRAVASVVGMGSAFGSVTSIGFSLLVGILLSRSSNNYFVTFVVAGVGYPTVLLILQLLEPHWEPIVEIDPATR